MTLTVEFLVFPTGNMWESFITNIIPWTDKLNCFRGQFYSLVSNYIQSVIEPVITSWLSWGHLDSPAALSHWSFYKETTRLLSTACSLFTELPGLSLWIIHTCWKCWSIARFMLFNSPSYLRWLAVMQTTVSGWVLFIVVCKASAEWMTQCHVLIMSFKCGKHN